MSVWRARIENLSELLNWLEENEPGLELLQEQAEGETDQLAELEARLETVKQMMGLSEGCETEPTEDQSSGDSSQLELPSLERSQLSSTSDSSTEIRVARPAFLMSAKMGEDVTKALLTTLNATDFPSGWEIRKSEHGQWGVYSPVCVGEPIVSIVDQGYKGFLFAMAVLGAFWCAHSVYAGELDARAVSDSVRLS